MSELEDFIYPRLVAFSREKLENMHDLFNGRIPGIYEPGVRPALVSIHNACVYVLHQRKYVDMMVQREERRRAHQPRVDSTNGLEHEETVQE